MELSKSWAFMASSGSKIHKGKEEGRTFISTDQFEVLLASFLNSIPFHSNYFAGIIGYSGEKMDSNVQHSCP